MGNDNSNVINIKNESVSSVPVSETPVEKQSALTAEGYPQTTTSIAQDQPTNTTNNINVVAQPIPQQTQVIDKTEEKVQLHSLSDSPDPITKDADQEEQEFIEEVQKEHTT
jgi:hypothetical protein